MKVNGMPLRWTCPTHKGWRWFTCSHEELRMPFIGAAIMVIGGVAALSGLADVL